jgi:hypothetical protein
MGARKDVYRLKFEGEEDDKEMEVDRRFVLDSPVNFHFFVVLFALKLEAIDVLPGPHHFRAIESGGDGGQEGRLSPQV